MSSGKNHCFYAEESCCESDSWINKLILRAPGRRSLLDRRLWLSNLRHVCGDGFHALRCSGTSGVEMKIYEWSLQALLPLPRPRFCQSPLACLSRVHFSRYPSRLSDLHLILMFSGPLQQDLFKEKWSLAKCTSNKIIVTLVTQGLPSSSLCRPLASSLATWAWESCDVRVTLFIVFDV